MMKLSEKFAARRALKQQAKAPRVATCGPALQRKQSHLEQLREAQRYIPGKRGMGRRGIR